MNYKEIGAFLKKEREQKGLSYHQVYEITRIQPSIIRSIEEGKPHISEVFFKNFIKTYIKFLDLDTREVFKIGDTKKSLKKEEPEEPQKKKPSRWSFKFFLFIAGMVFVLVLILSRSFLNKPSLYENNEEEQSEPITIVSKNLSKKMDLKRKVKASLKEGKNSEDRSEESSEAFNQTTDLKKQPSDEDLSLRQEKERISGNESEEAQSLFRQIRATNFQHELMIKSLEPLKIYFKIDQKSTVTKDLSPSLWFVIKAKESLYIRFDEKVDQVEMFYNGVKWKFTSAPFFEKTFKTQPVKP